MSLVWEPEDLVVSETPSLSDLNAQSTAALAACLALEDQAAGEYAVVLRQAARRASVEYKRQAQVLVAAGFDPSKHPRQPSGSDVGGEFAPKLIVAGPVQFSASTKALFLRDPNADDPDWDATVAKGYVQPVEQRGSVAQLEFSVDRDVVHVGLALTDDGHRRRGHALTLIRKLTELYPPDQYSYDVAVATPNGGALIRAAIARGILPEATALVASGDQGNVEGSEIVDQGALAESLVPIQRDVLARAAIAAAGQIGVALDVLPVFLEQAREQQRDGLQRFGEYAVDTANDAIHEATVNGLGVKEAATLIQDRGVAAADWQARTVARTQMVGTANAASLLAAKLAGPLFKTWLTAGDELVRPDHVEANGQTVPLDSPFQVGGEPLMFPGDPNGSDGEVINCRCTLIYTDNPAMVAAGNPYHEPAGSDHGGEFARKPAGELFGSDLDPDWTGPEIHPVTVEYQGHQLDALGRSAWSWDGEGMDPGGSGEHSDSVIEAANDNEVSVPEYKNLVAAELAAHVDDGTVVIRTPMVQHRYEGGPPNTVPLRILEDGRFKSQFETQTSSGALAQTQRRVQERMWFGYDEMMPLRNRPIYAMVEGPYGQPDAGQMYGEVAWRLKDDVKSRTTVTGVDSLGRPVVPGPARNPGWRATVPPGYTDVWGTVVEDPLEYGFGDNPEYIEAQVHGGVTLDDVAEVSLDDWDGDHEDTVELDALRRRLAERGIPFYVNGDLQGG